MTALLICLFLFLAVVLIGWSRRSERGARRQLRAVRDAARWAALEQSAALEPVKRGLVSAPDGLRELDAVEAAERIIREHRAGERSRG